MTVDLSLLGQDAELELLRALADVPEVLARAAELRAPHRVAHAAQDIAARFHRFYTECRVVGEDVELDAGAAVAVPRDATGAREPARAAGGLGARADGPRRCLIPGRRSARWTSTGLEVGGLAAADLAERFGTPVLVFDEDDLRDRMRALAAEFPRVAYAVKAMTCGAVIRAALEERLDLLCASAGEVRTCLRAGAPHHACSCTGTPRPTKSSGSRWTNGSAP